MDIPKSKIKVQKVATQKRKVLQIDPISGNVIKIWNSTREPKRLLGINNVNLVCNGQRKTMGGFIWKYAEEEFTLNLDDHKHKLSKSLKIEVFLDGISLGIYQSLRKAEEATKISRHIISAAMKSGESDKNGLQVIKI